MKFIKSMFILSMCFTGLSAGAASDYEYVKPCYKSQENGELIKSTCGINQLPQGDHHFTTIQFEDKTFLLSDEFTYTNEETYEGEYKFLIDDEVAERYLRDKSTLEIVEESSNDVPYLLCYKTSSIEICY